METTKNSPKPLTDAQRKALNDSAKKIRISLKVAVFNIRNRYENIK